MPLATAVGGSGFIAAFVVDWLPLSRAGESGESIIKLPPPKEKFSVLAYFLFLG